VDVPSISDEVTRLVHREADFFGNDSKFGFGAEQLVGPIGTAKGNRPFQGSPLADPRFIPPYPFVIKR